MIYPSRPGHFLLVHELAVKPTDREDRTSGRVRRQDAHRAGIDCAPRTRRPGVSPVDSPSVATSTPLTNVCR
jgi:hypothetical protein